MLLNRSRNSHMEQFDLHRIKRCRFFYDNFNFRFKFVASYECESVAVPKNRKGNPRTIGWIIIPSMPLGRPLLLKHSTIRYMVSVEDQRFFVNVQVWRDRDTLANNNLAEGV
ncbi:uncharacterized protein LOC112456528 [Temnothorax curvispinosus]|uniref:Uncharacterized protein LOC112456528 n=1 Tax=Temnothorax curvispinosus TaxID=300111 RepID=A0A6J1PZR6_9HYME|nr:uncharacterized protein LOC112456528 [Temnothorax curvispinosus]